MDRSLFMADQNLMKRGMVKFVKKGENSPTRIIEESLDPSFFRASTTI